jgi:CsoR family transcriptional regulator, copper-sensing transcriptional repressor
LRPSPIIEVTSAVIRNIPLRGMLRIMSHTKTPGYEASKEQLLNRAAGIEGQMGGDERMVGEGRSCVDVVGQITAAQAALNKLALGPVDDHVRDCMRPGEEACEAQVQEPMGPFSRFSS